MPIERPVLMQPVSGDTTIQYSARELRSAMLGSLFSREGVIDRDGGHLRVSQRGQGANMSVDVAAGRAAVFGDDASDQGAYSVNSTTVVNLAIPAPSQSASRTHRVILRVRDRSENGTWAPNTYDAVLQVQPDTTAAAALPPTAIPLATVTTPANASSVTTAMVGDMRKPATVGTPARTGDAPPFAGWYGVPNKQPKYSVTPDGVVLLSGQIMRGAATFTTAATTAYEFGTIPAAVLPTGPRLMLGLGQGYRTDTVLHISPNGRLYFSYNSAQVIVKDEFWISLDGVTYRIED